MNRIAKIEERAEKAERIIKQSCKAIIFNRDRLDRIEQKLSKLSSEPKSTPKPKAVDDKINQELDTEYICPECGLKVELLLHSSIECDCGVKVYLQGGELIMVKRFPAREYKT